MSADSSGLGADAPRRPEPIPLTVLTGFLGAGKTTLLNRLLRDPALADTVVIVNEFGEISLDHLLIERVDEDMILLGAGCLCCSVRGDLVAALEDLLRRRDNGRITPFRRVVIETTGLADPAPILHAVLGHPYLSLRYRLQSVIAAVDALHGIESLHAQPEAVRQAAMADRIVVTKTDLAGGMPDALVARLRRLNPGAPITGTDVPVAELLGGAFGLDGKIAEVRGWLGEEAVAASGSAQEPGLRDRHDASVRAFALTSDTLVRPAALEMFLDLLRSGHARAILRLKGVVALSDDPARPLLVHGVGHTLSAPVRLAEWPDADHRSRLVLIVRDLDPAFVGTLWDAFLGRPRVDAPDAKALSDNPLAPPGL